MPSAVAAASNVNANVGTAATASGPNRFTPIADLKNFAASTEHSEDPRPYLKGPGQKRTLLGWWYRIASPPEPQSSASFEQRELFRRGRTGSQVVLAILGIYISGLPDAFTGTSRFLAVILSSFLLDGFFIEVSRGLFVTAPV